MAATPTARSALRERHPGIAGGAVVTLTLIAVGLAMFYNGQDLVLYAGATGASLLALAVAVIAGAGGRESDPGIGPPLIVLAGLVAWTALAVTWSVVPYLTVIEVGTIGAALAVALAWRVVLPDVRLQAIAAAALVTLGAVIAATMLAQIAVGDRPVATFLNPNSAAGFLNLIWPIPAAMVLAGHGTVRRTTGLLAITAFLVFAVGIDAGRAVTIAAVAILVVLAVAGLRLGGGRRPVLQVAAVVLGALAVAWLANSLGFGGRGAGLGERLAGLADPAEAGSGRWPIWQATWALIREAPWLGHGPGTFFLAYAEHRLPGDATAGFFAHNDYLQFLAERGAPGLLLLLGLAVTCGWLYVRAITRRAPVVAPALLMAAGGALTGAAVHALFSYNLHVLPFVILFGAAITAMEVATPAPGTRRLPLSACRTSVVPGIALGAGLLVALAHLGMVGATYRYTQAGVELAGAGEFDRASGAYTTARRLWGSADPPWLGHADLYLRVLETLPAERTGLRRSARTEGLRMVTEARKRNPLRPGALATRGQLLLQSPGADPAEAREAFERALSLDPRAVRARLELARLHRDAGRPERARVVIEAGLDLEYGRRDPLPLLLFARELRRAAGDTAGIRKLDRRIREHRQRIPSSDPLSG